MILVESTLMIGLDPSFDSADGEVIRSSYQKSEKYKAGIVLDLWPTEPDLWIQGISAMTQNAKIGWNPKMRKKITWMPEIRL